jgi:alkyl hydroperoxide reductase subunit AhpC
VVGGIASTSGVPVSYPIISDTDLVVAKLYDMLHPNAVPGNRTVADNATIRSVVVIGPDKKVKATMAYPMSTGRNFAEVLRLLDSLQLTVSAGVATPVNWEPGQEVIIPVAVSNDEAAKKYPQGWRTLTPYLRMVQLQR